MPGESIRAFRDKDPPSQKHPNLLQNHPHCVLRHPERSLSSPVKQTISPKIRYRNSNSKPACLDLPEESQSISDTERCKFRDWGKKGCLLRHRFPARRFLEPMCCFRIKHKIRPGRNKPAKRSNRFRFPSADNPNHLLKQLAILLRRLLEIRLHESRFRLQMISEASTH